MLPRIIPLAEQLRQSHPEHPDVMHLLAESAFTLLPHDPVTRSFAVDAATGITWGAAIAGSEFAKRRAAALAAATFPEGAKTAVLEISRTRRRHLGSRAQTVAACLRAGSATAGNGAPPM